MSASTVDRTRLARLQAREEERFVELHPRSKALHERAAHSLLGGVPILKEKKNKPARNH
jgi:hypothetical protein